MLNVSVDMIIYIYIYIITLYKTINRGDRVQAAHRRRRGQGDHYDVCYEYY